MRPFSARRGWRGGRVRAEGYELVTADCILFAEQPRIAGRREDICARLAATMGVKEHTGFTGGGESLAAKAVVLLER